MSSEQTTRQRRASVDLLAKDSSTPQPQTTPTTTPTSATAAVPPPLVSRNSMAISEASSLDTHTDDKKEGVPPTEPSKDMKEVDVKRSAFHTFCRAHPFLTGWNHEDWWPCWIGLFLFGMVAIAVHHKVPEAHFQIWSSNPFDSLKTPGNYDLLVLFPLQGLLVWLAMWGIDAKAWKEFPKGYLVVYVCSFLSKWLAAQKSIKSASLGDSIWAILFGAIIRNAMGGKAMPDGRSKPLPPWLKVAQQTELYIACSLVLLW